MPVEPAHDGFDPISPELLTREALRMRFAAHDRPWDAELITDTRAHQDKKRDAAVLVPLVYAPETSDISILLTVRPSSLRSHSGQIAFPGGVVDAEDKDRAATALREAHEEVGIASSHIEVIGEMPEYQTGTGYRVTPVIGVIDALPPLTLSPREVDEVFQVPLHWLMDPNNHQRHEVTIDKAYRQFYAMPYKQDDIEYFIWGVTAAILRNLFHYIRA
jgi:8-oxo-dGTP pyrophosphatase MutT (NUDIX family)